MAKAPPAPPAGWTAQHDDALKAMLAFKLNKNYARAILEQLPEQKSLDDLVNMAFQAHGKSFKGQLPKGAPQNAVPLTSPATPPKPTTPAISLRSFVPSKPTQASGAQVKPAPISLKSFTPTQKAEKAKAAVEPEAAPAPEKPGIRMPLVSRQVPAAPLGGPAQQNAPSGQPAAAPATPAATPPVRIYSSAEYERLAPGTRFIWPDGHIYRKPEAEAEQAAPAS